MASVSSADFLAGEKLEVFPDCLAISGNKARPGRQVGYDFGVFGVLAAGAAGGLYAWTKYRQFLLAAISAGEVSANPLFDSRSVISAAVPQGPPGRQQEPGGQQRQHS